MCDTLHKRYFMLQATTAHMRMHRDKPYPQLWGDLTNADRRTKRGHLHARQPRGGFAAQGPCGI
jgi:hypothetical protein